MNRWLLIGLVIVLLATAGVVVVPTAAEKIKLAGLLPSVRDALQRVRNRLASEGIRTHVGQTRRTAAEQDAIDPSKTGTSNSWHELGRAVDLYVYGPDDKVDLDGKYVDLYRAMHAAAKDEGFTGLAFNADGTRRYITTKAGTKVWDGGHLEYRQGMTFAQAAAAGEVKGTA